MAKPMNPRSLANLTPGKKATGKAGVQLALRVPEDVAMEARKRGGKWLAGLIRREIERENEKA